MLEVHDLQSGGPAVLMVCLSSTAPHGRDCVPVQENDDYWAMISSRRRHSNEDISGFIYTDFSVKQIGGLRVCSWA